VIELHLAILAKQKEAVTPQFGAAVDQAAPPVNADINDVIFQNDLDLKRLLQALYGRNRLVPKFHPLFIR
jgi:hypothetical protein